MAVGPNFDVDAADVDSAPRTPALMRRPSELQRAVCLFRFIVFFQS
jgi:hypothetical protein